MPVIINGHMVIIIMDNLCHQFNGIWLGIFALTLFVVKTSLKRFVFVLWPNWYFGNIAGTDDDDDYNEISSFQKKDNGTAYIYVRT